MRSQHVNSIQVYTFNIYRLIGGEFMAKFGSNKVQSRPVTHNTVGRTVVNRNTVSGSAIPPKSNNNFRGKGIVMKPTVVTKPK